MELLRLLDVREVPDPWIGDAVWIPESELAHRVSELPSKRMPVSIANIGSEASTSVEWLRSVGYETLLVDNFAFGERRSGRLWSPNAFLEEVIGEVPKGRALDLACGSGRDAVFLATQGFEVVAIDHLPDALELGRRLESTLRGSAAPIHWKLMDLESEVPEGPYDLITCFFYLDRDLLRRLPLLLNSGGRMVFETFTVENRNRFGKPRSDRFLLQPDELPALVPGLVPIQYEEGLHLGRHTARLHAFN